MYFIIYNSGAMTYVQDANLKTYVNLISVGAVKTVIDVEKKRALFLAEKGVAWGKIVEESLPTDEDMKNLEIPAKSVDENKE
jgi:hypothetical protein